MEKDERNRWIMIVLFWIALATFIVVMGCKVYNEIQHEWADGPIAVMQ